MLKIIIFRYTMINYANVDFVKNNNNYQGITPSTYVATHPTVDFATISNIRAEKSLQIDSSIHLTGYQLSFDDFIACFYSQPGGSFTINSNNAAFKAILLTGQTYATTTNTFSWDLYNECIKAYCEKNYLPESSISSFKKINLTKETFRIQSLASNYGTQLGLSWDMVLNNLQVNNKIAYTKDADDYANVIFKLGYIYYSATLDVTLEIIFSYSTSIPYYRNIYGANNADNLTVAPYSKNENDDLTPSATLIPNFTNLLEIKTQNKKLKKKKLKKTANAPIDEQNNIQLDIESSEIDNNDYDNDSVLTKHIVNANRVNKNQIQNVVTYPTTEDDDESVDEENPTKPW